MGNEQWGCSNTKAKEMAMRSFEKMTKAECVEAQRAGSTGQDPSGDPNDSHDAGFLNRAWKHIEFQSAVGPSLKAAVWAASTWHLYESKRGRSEEILPITNSMARS